jgi:hypothetical protein
VARQFTRTGIRLGNSRPGADHAFIWRSLLAMLLTSLFAVLPARLKAQEHQAQGLGSTAGQPDAKAAADKRHDLATDIIQHSVVFIYSSDSPGNTNPLATGFLVRLVSKSNKTSFLELLVTARHVVEPGWQSCSHATLDRLFLRLNTPGYDPSSGKPGVSFEPLELIFQGKKQYFVPSDPTIDLAAVFLTLQNSPNFLKYGIQGLPFTAFAKPGEVKIGMPVFSLSLVPQFTGTQQNYPIFRTGNLASEPQDEFPSGVDCQGQLQTVKAWLIASHLEPGSSGAPIFLDRSSLPVLLGVQSFIMSGKEGSGRDERTIEYDVAGFTPIPYLYQLIRSMNLADADLTVGSHR